MDPTFCMSAMDTSNNAKDRDTAKDTSQADEEGDPVQDTDKTGSPASEKGKPKSEERKDSIRKSGNLTQGQEQESGEKAARKSKQLEKAKKPEPVEQDGENKKLEVAEKDEENGRLETARKSKSMKRTEENENLDGALENENLERAKRRNEEVEIEMKQEPQERYIPAYWAPTGPYLPRRIHSSEVDPPGFATIPAPEPPRQPVDPWEHLPQFIEKMFGTLPTPAPTPASNPNTCNHLTIDKPMVCCPLDQAATLYLPNSGQPPMVVPYQTIPLPHMSHMGQPDPWALPVLPPLPPPPPPPPPPPFSPFFSPDIWSWYPPFPPPPPYDEVFLSHLLPVNENNLQPRAQPSPSSKTKLRKPRKRNHSKSKDSTSTCSGRRKCKADKCECDEVEPDKDLSCDDEDEEWKGWSHPSVRGTKWWHQWDKSQDGCKKRKCQTQDPMRDFRSRNTQGQREAFTRRDKCEQSMHRRPTIGHMTSYRPKPEPRDFVQKCDCAIECCLKESSVCDTDSVGGHATYTPTGTQCGYGHCHLKCRCEAANTCNGTCDQTESCCGHVNKNNEITEVNATFLRSIQVCLKSSKDKKKTKKFNVSVDTVKLLGSLLAGHSSNSQAECHRNITASLYANRGSNVCTQSNLSLQTPGQRKSSHFSKCLKNQSEEAPHEPFLDYDTVIRPRRASNFPCASQFGCFSHTGCSAGFDERGPEPHKHVRHLKDWMRQFDQDLLTLPYQCTQTDCEGQCGTCGTKDEKTGHSCHDPATESGSCLETKQNGCACKSIQAPSNLNHGCQTDGRLTKYKSHGKTNCKHRVGHRKKVSSQYVGDNRKSHKSSKRSSNFGYSTHEMDMKTRGYKHCQQHGTINVQLCRHDQCCPKKAQTCCQLNCKPPSNCDNITGTRQEARLSTSADAEEIEDDFQCDVEQNKQADTECKNLLKSCSSAPNLDANCEANCEEVQRVAACCNENFVECCQQYCPPCPLSRSIEVVVDNPCPKGDNMTDCVEEEEDVAECGVSCCCPESKHETHYQKACPSFSCVNDQRVCHQVIPARCSSRVHVVSHGSSLAVHVSIPQCKTTKPSVWSVPVRPCCEVEDTNLGVHGCRQEVERKYMDEVRKLGCVSKRRQIFAQKCPSCHRSKSRDVSCTKSRIKCVPKCPDDCICDICMKNCGVLSPVCEGNYTECTDKVKALGCCATNISPCKVSKIRKVPCRRRSKGIAEKCKVFCRDDQESSSERSCSSQRDCCYKKCCVDESTTPCQKEDPCRTGKSKCCREESNHSRLENNCSSITKTRPNQPCCRGLSHKGKHTKCKSSRLCTSDTQFKDTCRRKKCSQKQRCMSEIACEENGTSGDNGRCTSQGIYGSTGGPCIWKLKKRSPCKKEREAETVVQEDTDDNKSERACNPKNGPHFRIPRIKCRVADKRGTTAEGRKCYPRDCPSDRKSKRKSNKSSERNTINEKDISSDNDTSTSEEKLKPSEVPCSQKPNGASKKVQEKSERVCDGSDNEDSASDYTCSDSDDDNDEPCIESPSGESSDCVNEGRSSNCRVHPSQDVDCHGLKGYKIKCRELPPESDRQECGRIQKLHRDMRSSCGRLACPSDSHTCPYRGPSYTRCHQQDPVHSCHRLHRYTEEHSRCDRHDSTSCHHYSESVCHEPNHYCEKFSSLHILDETRDPQGRHYLHEESCITTENSPCSPCLHDTPEPHSKSSCLSNYHFRCKSCNDSRSFETSSVVSQSDPSCRIYPHQETNARTCQCHTRKYLLPKSDYLVRRRRRKHATHSAHSKNERETGPCFSCSRSVNSCSPKSSDCSLHEGSSPSCPPPEGKRSPRNNHEASTICTVCRSRISIPSRSLSTESLLQEGSKIYSRKSKHKSNSVRNNRSSSRACLHSSKHVSSSCRRSPPTSDSQSSQQNSPHTSAKLCCKLCENNMCEESSRSRCRLASRQRSPSDIRESNSSNSSCNEVVFDKPCCHKSRRRDQKLEKNACRSLAPTLKARHADSECARRTRSLENTTRVQGKCKRQERAGQSNSRSASCRRSSSKSSNRSLSRLTGKKLPFMGSSLSRSKPKVSRRTNSPFPALSSHSPSDVSLSRSLSGTSLSPGEIRRVPHKKKKCSGCSKCRSTCTSPCSNTSHGIASLSTRHYSAPRSHGKSQTQGFHHGERCKSPEGQKNKSEQKSPASRTSCHNTPVRSLSHKSPNYETINSSQCGLWTMSSADKPCFHNDVQTRSNTQKNSSRSFTDRNKKTSLGQVSSAAARHQHSESHHLHQSPRYSHSKSATDIPSYHSSSCSLCQHRRSSAHDDDVISISCQPRGGDFRPISLLSSQSKAYGRSYISGRASRTREKSSGSKKFSKSSGTNISDILSSNDLVSCGPESHPNQQYSPSMLPDASKVKDESPAVSSTENSYGQSEPCSSDTSDDEDNAEEEMPASDRVYVYNSEACAASPNEQLNLCKSSNKCTPSCRCKTCQSTQENIPRLQDAPSKTRWKHRHKYKEGTRDFCYVTNKIRQCQTVSRSHDQANPETRSRCKNIVSPSVTETKIPTLSESNQETTFAVAEELYDNESKHTRSLKAENRYVSKMATDKETPKSETVSIRHASQAGGQYGTRAAMVSCPSTRHVTGEQCGSRHVTKWTNAPGQKPLGDQFDSNNPLSQCKPGAYFCHHCGSFKKSENQRVSSLRLLSIYMNVEKPGESSDNPKVDSVGESQNGKNLPTYGGSKWGTQETSNKHSSAACANSTLLSGQNQRSLAPCRCETCQASLSPSHSKNKQPLHRLKGVKNEGLKGLSTSSERLCYSCESCAMLNKERNVSEPRKNEHKPFFSVTEKEMDPLFGRKETSSSLLTSRSQESFGLHHSPGPHNKRLNQSPSNDREANKERGSQTSCEPPADQRNSRHEHSGHNQSEPPARRQGNSCSKRKSHKTLFDGRSALSPSQSLSDNETKHASRRREGSSKVGQRKRKRKGTKLKFVPETGSASSKRRAKRSKSSQRKSRGRLTSSSPSSSREASVSETFSGPDVSCKNWPVLVSKLSALLRKLCREKGHSRQEISQCGKISKSLSDSDLSKQSKSEENKLQNKLNEQKKRLQELEHQIDHGIVKKLCSDYRCLLKKEIQEFGYGIDRKTTETCADLETGFWSCGLNRSRYQLDRHLGNASMSICRGSHSSKHYQTCSRYSDIKDKRFTTSDIFLRKHCPFHAGDRHDSTMKFALHKSKLYPKTAHKFTCLSPKIAQTSKSSGLSTLPSMLSPKFFSDSRRRSSNTCRQYLSSNGQAEVQKDSLESSTSHHRKVEQSNKSKKSYSKHKDKNPTNSEIFQKTVQQDLQAVPDDKDSQLKPYQDTSTLQPINQDRFDMKVKDLSNTPTSSDAGQYVKSYLSNTPTSSDDGQLVKSQEQSLSNFDSQNVDKDFKYGNSDVTSLSTPILKAHDKRVSDPLSVKSQEGSLSNSTPQNADNDFKGNHSDIPPSNTPKLKKQSHDENVSVKFQEPSLSDSDSQEEDDSGVIPLNTPKLKQNSLDKQMSVKSQERPLSNSDPQSASKEDDYSDVIPSDTLKLKKKSHDKRVSDPLSLKSRKRSLSKSASRNADKESKADKSDGIPSNTPELKLKTHDKRVSDPFSEKSKKTSLSNSASENADKEDDNSDVIPSNNPKLKKKPHDKRVSEKSPKRVLSSSASENTDKEDDNSDVILSNTPKLKKKARDKQVSVKPKKRSLSNPTSQNADKKGASSDVIPSNTPKLKLKTHDKREADPLSVKSPRRSLAHSAARNSDNEDGSSDAFPSNTPKLKKKSHRKRGSERSTSNSTSQNTDRESNNSDVIPPNTPKLKSHDKRESGSAPRSSSKKGKSTSKQTASESHKHKHGTKKEKHNESTF